MVDVKEDNTRLSSQNARLQERVRKLEALEEENRRLHRLLDLKQSLKTEVVSAQVIGKNTNEFFRVARVTLDRDARDVGANLPVLSQDGVVGTTLKTAGDTVDVRLVVDAGSSVDVVVQRTGARGFVRGTGDESKYSCSVQYVERTDEVEVGDLLVTSGVGRRFPKGIPVATVTQVVRRDFGIYQQVTATPTVDFSRVEEVLILTSVPGEDTKATRDAPGQAPRGPRRSSRGRMRNTAFLAIGIALLVIQSNLFRLIGHLHIPGATPSLLLPLVVFMGVHEYSMARGAALSFTLGYLLDVFAAAPTGLFTFITVATFVVSRAAGVRLAAQTLLTKLALAFVFSLVQGSSSSSSRRSSAAIRRGRGRSRSSCPRTRWRRRSSLR